MHNSSSSFLFVLYQIDGSGDESGDESGDGTQDSIPPIKVNNTLFPHSHRVGVLYRQGWHGPINPICRQLKLFIQTL